MCAHVAGAYEHSFRNRIPHQVGGGKKKNREPVLQLWIQHFHALRRSAARIRDILSTRPAQIGFMAVPAFLLICMIWPAMAPYTSADAAISLQIAHATQRHPHKLAPGGCPDGHCPRVFPTPEGRPMHRIDLGIFHQLPTARFRCAVLDLFPAENPLFTISFGGLMSQFLGAFLRPTQLPAAVLDSSANRRFRGHIGGISSRRFNSVSAFSSRPETSQRLQSFSFTRPARFFRRPRPVLLKRLQFSLR